MDEKKRLNNILKRILKWERSLMETFDKLENNQSLKSDSYELRYTRLNLLRQEVIDLVALAINYKLISLTNWPNESDPLVPIRILRAVLKKSLEAIEIEIKK